MYGWADAEDPLRGKVDLALVAGERTGTEAVDRRKSVLWPSSPGSSRSKSEDSDVSKASRAVRIPGSVPEHLRRSSRVQRFLVRMVRGICGGTRQEYIGEDHGLKGKALIYFTTVFVSLGVFLFGYDQGVMSGIITGDAFNESFNNPSKATIGTIVAILEVGAFISSLAVGRIGDSLGRRRTILHGSLIFLVGGALQTLAGSTATMMVGRFVAGLGVGMLSTMVPVYQSEISPAHNRGRLACIEFSGNVAGYATSVWVGYVCGFVPGNFAWRAPLSLQCVGGALLALGSAVALVESPRWLLDHDRDEEGLLVIARLYASEDDEDGQAAVDVRSPQARAVFSEIKANVLLQREAEGSNGAHTYADMFQRYRKRVLIAMSAQALAQLNGINVISYYAPLVFEEAGWKGHSAVLMTGVNALMYLAATVVPWFAVDRWGRRPILLSGAMAMAASLCVISFLLYVNVASTPTLVVVFVMIYNAAFGYSWGPVPWLYPPEILPLDIRSKGASLSTATNWAFNWVVGEATPVLQEWITWRLYLLHAFWCATSFVVVYFAYPETRGVHLEDMDTVFGEAVGGRQLNDEARPGRDTPMRAVDDEERPILDEDEHDDDRISLHEDLDDYSKAPSRRSKTVRKEISNALATWLTGLFGRKRSGAAADRNRGRGYAPVGQGD